MKKWIGVLFSLFAATSLFAANISLYAVDTSYNTVDIRNNESYQTIYTEDGVEISVGAKFSGDDVRYDFEIKNRSNKDFYFDTNFITVYQGNFGSNDWNNALSKISANSNNANPLQPNQNENQNKDEKIAEGVVAAVVVGAFAIGAIALFDWLLNDDHKSQPPRKNQTPYKSHPKRINRHNHDDSLFDDIMFMHYLSVTENNNNDTYTRDDTLSSKNIERGRNYYGSFYSSRNGGPDYKLVLRIPGEGSYDLTFKNTDRSDIYYSKRADKNYAPKNAELEKLKSETKVSIVYGQNILSDAFNSSLYAMYLGNPIGVYGGFAMDVNSLNISIKGYFFNHDPGNTVLAGTSDHYRFVYDNIYVKDSFTLSGGATVKLAPCVWLIGGCGVDLTFRYPHGSVYDANSGTTVTGYFEEKTPYFIVAPEIGINSALGIFDFGVMARFPLSQDPEIKWLLGIAF